MRNTMTRWKQDKFYLSTFDPMRHDATPAQAEEFIRLTREAGFNLVEFTFRDRAQVTTALEACEKAGVASIVQDPCFGGVGSGSFENSPFKGGRCLPSEETVREAVTYYRRFSHVLGFYVWDEPQATAFADCRRNTDLFRAIAPDKLAFSVIYPSYGVYTWKDTSALDWTDNGYTRYVNGYLETVDPDVFSMDYYAFYMNRRTEDIRHCDLWRDLGYCRKRALELNKPQWFYYQGHGEFVASDDAIAEMTPEKVQMQMYAALAYGVKQLSCFCSSPLLFDGYVKNARFYEPIRTINGRICRLGNELLDKTPLKIYHSGLEADYVPLYFLDDITADGVIAAASPDLVIGRLTDDAGRVYLMVSNLSFSAPRDAVLSLAAPYAAEAFDEDTGVYAPPVTTDSLSFTLSAGHGRLFRLTQR